jgi:hypothetical protein
MGNWRPRAATAFAGVAVFTLLGEGSAGARKRAAVALAATAALVAGCGAGSHGAHPPGAGGDGTLLRPGGEVDGMRLTTATEADTEVLGRFCYPVILRPGIYARDCQVPQLPRLMIGYGNIAATPDLLEQEWQAQRWQLYLDGWQVDLAAFGTLPDKHIVEPAAGGDVWLREWSITLVNPTPGAHTLRYVSEQSPAGDAPVGTIDAIWTFTIVQSTAAGEVPS